MSSLENFIRINERDDSFNSQSSDEKMDTTSESFLSTQNTPNSVLSSDFDEKEHSDANKSDDVLRLQDPLKNDLTDTVLRLAEPMQDVNNHNCLCSESAVHNCKEEINKIVTNMSSLRINLSDQDENSKNIRPNHLGISPPKSTLTSTTNHPLMGLCSPDSIDKFPDVVPEKTKLNLLKIEEQVKDSSLSSCEENNIPQDGTSFLEYYQDGPQRNTSKNNLYFSDNFTTADSQILNGTSTSPPDIAKVQPNESLMKRKVVSRLKDLESSPKVACSTPQRALGRIVDGNMDESAILKYVEERNKKFSGYGESTPKSAREGSEPLDISVAQESFHYAVADWCESPSLLGSLPNFQLPIEMSSNIRVNTQELDSPDLTSTEEDHSTYQAMLDPYSGSVALRHRTPTSNTTPKRKIIARVETEEADEKCSLDSLSDCSIRSEELLEDQDPEQRVEVEAPAPAVDGEVDSISDDDSKCNTLSSYTEPIPEYSAADERLEERAWLKVALPTGGRSSCDMKVIEPYKRVLSHGGYEASGCAIIVFSACHLPDSQRCDYNYVMDNLFLYVLWTLDRLVTDEYVLVYLHGSAAKRRLPTFHWLYECYKLIDRRLRKSLKHLYLVHPTLWIKTIFVLCKPFISSKFYRKISYVKNLKELMDRVPVEPNAIPNLVKEYDSVKR